MSAFQTPSTRAAQRQKYDHNDENNNNNNNNNNNEDNEYDGKDGEHDSLQWQKQELHDINVRISNIFQYVDAFDTALNNDGISKDSLQKKFDDELKTLQDRFDDLLSKWKSENNELNHKNRELLNDNKEKEKLLNDLKKQADFLKNEILNLNKEKEIALHEKQENANDIRSKMDKITAENATLKKEDEHLKEENNRLKNNASKLNMELQNQFAEQLRERLQEKDDEWNKMKDQMIQIWKDEASKKAKEYQNSISNLQSKINHFKDEIFNLQQKNGDLEKERLILLNEIGKLKQEIDNLNKIVNQCKLEKEQKNERLEKEFKDLKDAYQRQNFELQSTKSTNESLNDEIFKLKKKITEFERRHSIESPVPIKQAPKRHSIESSIKEPPSKRQRLNDYLLPDNSLKNIQENEDIKLDVDPVVVQRFQTNPNNNNNYNNISAGGVVSTLNNHTTKHQLQQQLQKFKKVPLEGFPLQLYKTSFTKDNKNKFVGFEINNNTQRPVELRGFHFSNKKGDQKLNIPQRIINPNQKLRVIFGTEKDKINNDDLIWEVDNNTLANISQESLLIKDKTGNYAELFHLSDNKEIPKDGCLMM